MTKSAFSERYTDAGNGRYFARVFGDDVRYIRERGVWIVNRSTHWAEDTDGELMRFAKLTTNGMFEGLGDLPREQREARIRHALKSESAPRMVAALTMLQSEPGITIPYGMLDRDPFLLGVRNGVIDLRNGEFRLPRGDEYITRRAGCGYNPHARSPVWQACLMRWMADDIALVEYLQRAIGYSLTGDMREQCFFVLYGAGSNGKTSFTEVLRSLLGAYGATANIATFIDRRGDAATNDLAALAGVRMVCASEPAEGARLAESLVKALTGGEAIRARFLFREFFEYAPQFKIWLATNHKPTVRGTDQAIWRRVRLIPFSVTIPRDEQDPTLGSKLALELSGILNWAIAGCLAWQRVGLDAPSAVVDATAAYRREQDRVGQWIEEHCILAPNACGQASVLYRDYRGWAEQRGEHPVSLTRFGLTLGDRGFESSDDSHKRKTYHGIGLVGDDASNVIPMQARIQ
jgi:putative DNA primase/helicase